MLSTHSDLEKYTHFDTLCCCFLCCPSQQFMQRPKEEELKAKIRAEQQRRMKESHWVLREESTRFVDTFFFTSFHFTHTSSSASSRWKRAFCLMGSRRGGARSAASTRWWRAWRRSARQRTSSRRHGAQQTQPQQARQAPSHPRTRRPTRPSPPSATAPGHSGAATPHRPRAHARWRLSSCPRPSSPLPVPTVVPARCNLLVVTNEEHLRQTSTQHTNSS